MKKEAHKPRVGYEMCGDKVYLIIPHEDNDEHILVMTKDLFIDCYEHWINKAEHDRQPSVEQTGKWLYYLDNGRMRCKCSNCLTSYGCLDTPYCPNCGFKMEG